METSILTTSNVTNLAECVLELISNSLNANATSIAIRIHAEDRKIQVIDNGTGILKKGLKPIAEYNVCNYSNVQDICNSRKQTIVNIRKLSDAVIITSRHHCSSKTYMKICKVNCVPKIVKVRARPSYGTTVSIYGFHELSLGKWNVPLMYFFVSNIAIINPRVSFSIRDDQKRKVIMTIKRPHSPVGILKLLYDRKVLFNKLWYIKNVRNSDLKFLTYIGLVDFKSNATQYIFLNNRPVHCPLILQVTSAVFIDTLRSFVKVQHQQTLMKEKVFILLFITCAEYIFSIEKGKRTLILPKIQNFLQSIRNEVLNIFLNNIMPLSNSVKKHSTSIAPKDCILQTLHHVVKTKVTKLKITQTAKNIIKMQNTETTSYINCLNRMEVDDTNNQEELKDNGSVNQLTMNKINNIDQLFRPNSQNNNVIERNNVLTLSEWSNWTYIDNNIDQLCTPNLQNNNVVERNNGLTLSEWSNWTYIDNNNNIDQLCTPNLQNNNVIEQNAVLTLSEWSNWTYTDNNNSVPFYKQFDFLPKNLHKLLRGNKKLTRTNILNKLDGNILSAELKAGLNIPDTLLHQDMDVRPCKVVQRFQEFRLHRELLRFIKILGQMNNELIVGLAIQDDMKVLVLMDQHAVHERILYENFLEEYKSQARNQLLSVKLKDPIVIQLPTESCNLLQSNKTVLHKFGLSLSIMNGDTIIVRTVPECLRKNKYNFDEFKLQLNVKNLLNEILQNSCNNNGYGINNLPFTIHNAIATEACHGAVRFGDPLSLKQCRWLLKFLKRTKAPTRCAHGRPSIVPILELSELERRRKNTSKKKLNFEALKLRHRRKLE